MSALIEFDDVCKYYQMGDTTVKAVDHISMQIQKGEFVAIVGPVRFGQVHLHEHHRLPGRADIRHLPAERSGRGQHEQERAGRDPQRDAGLHLPAVQTFCPNSP